jgi:hypothetical protein
MPHQPTSGSWDGIPHGVRQISYAYPRTVAGDEDGHVARHPDYSQGDLKVVTLREAVLRRPAMYFGGYRPPDWPLVIAAWTAAEMLDYAVPPRRQAAVTLHRNGDLSASVAMARIVQPAAALRLPVEELVRRRMWWHQLARSTTVVAGRDGEDAAEPQHVDDRLVWTDLAIVVRLELDAQLIGIASEAWWQDGPARLQDVLATLSFHLAAHDQLVVLDEATGTTLNLIDPGSACIREADR